MDYGPGSADISQINILQTSLAPNLPNLELKAMNGVISGEDVGASLEELTYSQKTWDQYGGSDSSITLDFS
ncbi:hypothetical protein Tco_0054113 [Tanacetum coccineum]